MELGLLADTGHGQEGQGERKVQEVEAALVHPSCEPVRWQASPGLRVHPVRARSSVGCMSPYAACVTN